MQFCFNDFWYNKFLDEFANMIVETVSASLLSSAFFFESQYMNIVFSSSLYFMYFYIFFLMLQEAHVWFDCAVGK